MTKPKTLDQLQAEKEQAETQLAQEQHKLERLENRKKYLEKGERTKRTHRLCNLGGTVESLAPEVKDLTRTEMTGLMEQKVSCFFCALRLPESPFLHYLCEANQRKIPVSFGVFGKPCITQRKGKGNQKTSENLRPFCLAPC